MTCGHHAVQDKNALEQKVKDLQALMETVQNQRNELRQAFKVFHLSTAPSATPIPQTCTHADML